MRKTTIRGLPKAHPNHPLPPVDWQAPTTDSHPPAKCPSCGVPYVDHAGLIGTCERLKLARETLATLAETLRIRNENAARLCRQTLEKTKP